MYKITKIDSCTRDFIFSFIFENNNMVDSIKVIQGKPSVMTEITVNFSDNYHIFACGNLVVSLLDGSNETKMTVDEFISDLSSDSSVRVTPSSVTTTKINW